MECVIKNSKIPISMASDIISNSHQRLCHLPMGLQGEQFAQVGYYLLKSHLLFVYNAKAPPEESFIMERQPSIHL